MSRKVSIRVLLMSLVYLHHLVLRSPVASFATMPKPSAAILEDRRRGPAAAACTQTHRNFRDQETRHSFSFWWTFEFHHSSRLRHKFPTQLYVSEIFSQSFISDCQFHYQITWNIGYAADIPPACFICVDREFVLVSKHWDAFLRLLQQAVFTPERLLPTEPLKRHIGAFLYY